MLPDIVFLTWTNQVSAESTTEVMKDAISVSLSHSGMNIIAAVAQLRDLLS